MSAQQWSWASNIGPYTDVDYGPFVRTDSSGTLFTAVMFDDGDYQYHSKITKRNSSGVLLWSKSMTGWNQFNYLVDMEIDKNNNIYVIGFFCNLLSFANSTVYSSHGWSYFVASFDKDGKERWLLPYPEIYNGGNSLTVDHNGDVIFAGFDVVNSSWRIGKLNSSGSQIWLKNYVTNARTTKIKCDSHNNIFVSGFTGNEAFKINNVVYPTQSLQYWNNCLVKFSPDGVIEKVEVIAGARISSFSFDKKDNIYAAGLYNDSIKVRQQSIFADTTCRDYYHNVCEEHFIAKLNTRDSCSWIKRIKGNFYPLVMTVSRDGDLYVTGSTGSKVVLDTILIKPDTFMTFIFVVKFNNSGTAQWVQKSSGNYISACQSNDIAYSQNNSLYLGGVYQSNNFYLNTQCWFGNDTLPYTGYSYNFYIVKLDDNQITNLINEKKTAANSLSKVFPNPGSDVFTVELEQVDTKARICVFDLLGNCILEKILVKNGREKIDLSSQSKGIYFVEINFEGKKEVKKIMLE